MRTAILLAALLAAPAAAQTAQPAEKGPWIDWTELNRRAAAPPVVPDPPRPEPEARALGDRVGQMVAAGDCRGGERIAMEAGDSALVRAVRNYCKR